MGSGANDTQIRVATTYIPNTRQHLSRCTFAGIAQLVERNLAKVDVAGSSPVSRSTM
jgi:hypothetical protein